MLTQVHVPTQPWLMMVLSIVHPLPVSAALMPRCSCLHPPRALTDCRHLCQAAALQLCAHPAGQAPARPRACSGCMGQAQPHPAGVDQQHQPGVHHLADSQQRARFDCLVNVWYDAFGVPHSDVHSPHLPCPQHRGGGGAACASARGSVNHHHGVAEERSCGRHCYQLHHP